MPNGVLRVKRRRTTELIANLSAFCDGFSRCPSELTILNPVEPGQHDSVGGNLYAIEPNHGELDKITPEGQISRISDISAEPGAHRADGNRLSGQLSM